MPVTSSKKLSKHLYNIVINILVKFQNTQLSNPKAFKSMDLDKRKSQNKATVLLNTNNKNTLVNLNNKKTATD